MKSKTKLKKETWKQFLTSLRRGDTIQIKTVLERENALHGSRKLRVEGSVGWKLRTWKNPNGTFTGKIV